jgi:SAM-dependent MidA family methyltransferase
MQGHPGFIDEIQGEIAGSPDGRITFARFMELALYHPQRGYYTRQDRPRVGKAGDFFTSVSVGPLFGRILARQIEKWSVADVTEFGGHRGQLRADVLAASPQLNYRVVEQTDPLPDTLTGLVLSNELLDALPVHRVGVKDGQWMEYYVNDQFKESLGPLSDPRLAGQLAGLPVHLMEGYRTEINLRALDWLTAISQRMRTGYILTIDYGFERTDYFAPHRRDGHLQCYFQHTKNTDPYRNIGQQDITAHVEFSSLIEHGRSLGFEPVLFTDQTHFLLEAGKEIIEEIVTRTAGKISPERNAVHQLTHPNLMGHAFKILVQRRKS